MTYAIPTRRSCGRQGVFWKQFTLGQPSVDSAFEFMLVTPSTQTAPMFLENVQRPEVRALICCGVALCCAWAIGPAIRANDSSPPQPAGQTVLVLGDSIAAGYGLDPSESFPAQLQEKIEALGWPVKVVNAGLSGDTSAGGLRRLDWLLKQKIDVL